MKYTDTHEWVSLEGNVATIGITEYAQRELGAIVYVELPSLNQDLMTGEEAVVLESTKAAVDVYTPLSGKVVAVNSSLKESPERVNIEPRGGGWLFKIQLLDLSEYNQLLDENGYEKLMGHSS